MKVRVTRKQIKENYPRIIGASYCALQTLLNYEQPLYYCTRAEGWACDVYTFGDVAISTGYAYFENRHANYEICQRYEKMAEGKTREERRELIDQFIEEMEKRKKSH